MQRRFLLGLHISIIEFFCCNSRYCCWEGMFLSNDDASVTIVIYINSVVRKSTTIRVGEMNIITWFLFVCCRHVFEFKRYVHLPEYAFCVFDINSFVQPLIPSFPHSFLFLFTISKVGRDFETTIASLRMLVTMTDIFMPWNLYDICMPCMRHLYAMYATFVCLLQ